jgi:hypothetical protein
VQSSSLRKSENFQNLARYAEFLLEINLKILLRKTGPRLNLKFTLKSLHIHPEPISNEGKEKFLVQAKN